MSNPKSISSPLVKEFSQDIEIEESTTRLCLFVVEYENAIQLAIYENKPTLGSMSFGYIDGDITQNLEIFTGNHNQFASALALIIAKRTNKLVYGSVNLNRETIVELKMIRKLIDQYLQTLV